MKALIRARSSSSTRTSASRCCDRFRSRRKLRIQSENFTKPRLYRLRKTRFHPSQQACWRPRGFRQTDRLFLRALRIGSCTFLRRACCFGRVFPQPVYRFHSTGVRRVEQAEQLQGFSRYSSSLGYVECRTSSISTTRMAGLPSIASCFDDASSREPNSLFKIRLAGFSRSLNTPDDTQITTIK